MSEQSSIHNAIHQLETIVALHQPCRTDATTCNECGHNWPCMTHTLAVSTLGPA